MGVQIRNEKTQGTNLESKEKCRRRGAEDEKGIRVGASRIKIQVLPMEGGEGLEGEGGVGGGTQL